MSRPEVVLRCHVTVGGGTPVTLQCSQTLSPSCTVTSLLENSSTISAGTARQHPRMYDLHLSNHWSTIAIGVCVKKTARKACNNSGDHRIFSSPIPIRSRSSDFQTAPLNFPFPLPLRSQALVVIVHFLSEHYVVL